MDLQSDCSPLEYVEENEVITNSSGKLVNTEETKIENNGTCVIQTNEKENKVLEFANSPLPTPVTVKPSSPSPSPVTTKGKGLKKWRRIRREISGDGASNVDSGKLLKRGLSNSGANSNKPIQFSAEMKQNSEESASSTKAMVKSLGAVVDHFAAIGDSGLVAGPILAAGAESENSEDHSSKSSTAASAPKMRYEMPMVTGFTRDKNRVRNPTGKSLGNTVQRGHQGKVRTETSKKLRGELVKVEKENSHSSMESDSRSSNFLFMQGNNFTTSNGGQSGRSINYDGENSDEAQGSEQQLSEELQSRSNILNGVDFEVNSQENLVADSSSGVKEEKNEDNGPSRDLDPLVESIITLQSAQAELEKEVQKFREIGKEDLSDESILDGSSEQLQFGDLLQQSSDSLGTEVICLKQKVNLLESNLDDATTLLKVKESEIVELETILNGRLPKGETAHAMELHPENYNDMEIELEGLFKQKIEAEVEYFAISRTIQKLRVAVVDQITILGEHKTEQARLLSKLEDTEIKAAVLKEESEKLENYREDIVSSDETLKLKTQICKHASCFILQLIFLFVILTLFLWQFSPHYSEVVPT